jgi:transposase
VDRKKAVEIYREGEERTVEEFLKQDSVIEKLKHTFKRIEKAVTKWKKRFCHDCFEKQQRLDTLEEEVRSLKAKLRYREQKETQGYFGSSTPSSKKPFKKNTLEENQKKRGGAKKGHKGNGRRSIEEEEADIVEELPILEDCPHCGIKLEDKGSNDRTVIEIESPKVKKKLYTFHVTYCPRCNKTFYAKPPSVMPKQLYGNQLLSQSATMHYMHGIPLGRINEVFGINTHHLYGTFHRLAKLFAPTIDRLTEQYRNSPAKHADETGWRTDGQSGYAWLFCTKKLSIYKFRDTRSAMVPREVFGSKPLPGVLTVDRYSAYNKMPCKIQYCYEHLHREVKDLEAEFPDEKEVKDFCRDFGKLLAKAMKLRTQKISDPRYYKKAENLKNKIIEAVNKDAKHLGIRRIQDIFREQQERMYQWVTDRRVAADNNFCEQEIRTIVIARKVSFGSQSEKGAHTREIMMTLLHSLQKQTGDAAKSFKDILDKIADDPDRDPNEFILPYFDSS